MFMFKIIYEAFHSSPKPQPLPFTHELLKLQDRVKKHVFEKGLNIKKEDVFLSKELYCKIYTEWLGIFTTYQEHTGQGLCLNGMFIFSEDKSFSGDIRFEIETENEVIIAIYRVEHD